MDQESKTNGRSTRRLLLWIAIFYLAYGLIDSLAVLIPMIQSR